MKSDATTLAFLLSLSAAGVALPVPADEPPTDREAQIRRALALPEERGPVSAERAAWALGLQAEPLSAVAAARTEASKMPARVALALAPAPDPLPQEPSSLHDMVAALSRDVELPAPAAAEWSWVPRPEPQPDEPAPPVEFHASPVLMERGVRTAERDQLVALAPPPPKDPDDDDEPASPNIERALAALEDVLAPAAAEAHDEPASANSAKVLATLEGVLRVFDDDEASAVTEDTFEPLAPQPLAPATFARLERVAGHELLALAAPPDDADEPDPTAVPVEQGWAAGAKVLAALEDVLGLPPPDEGDEPQSPNGARVIASLEDVLAAPRRDPPPALEPVLRVFDDEAVDDAEFTPEALATAPLAPTAYARLERAATPSDKVLRDLAELAERMRQAREEAAERAKPNPMGQGWAMLVRRELDTVRGGFTAANGLRISFGIERLVYIDGNLVATTRLNVSELGAVTGTGAGPSSAPGFSLIQNGAGNTFTGTIAPGAIGTVIQNTLNGQNIRNTTVINATVNSLDVLRALNMQSTLRNAVTDSLRR